MIFAQKTEIADLQVSVGPKDNTQSLRFKKANRKRMHQLECRCVMEAIKYDSGANRYRRDVRRSPGK
jgi:hypothetical protein